MEGREAFAPGATRAEALAALRRRLAEAGLDAPALEARLLLAHALGVPELVLVTAPEERLGEAGAARLNALASRRIAREPLARILGAREFWGLPFVLSPEALVPRPDTETLVEEALSGVPDRARSLSILDLGTGSGCILVALLHELPEAWGLGVDRSPGALGSAAANAAANGVAARAGFSASDWASAVAGPFDLVVSNPPYIASAVIEGLEEEVRSHDPRAALDGGPDGLDAYRAILGEAPRLLAPGGRLVLEIGYDQEDALRLLAGRAGLALQAVRRDLGGHPRAVALTAG